jgi:putative component of membrane protein insertase Oxa1/YidC/SpoIIIJ protein YidD
MKNTNLIFLIFFASFLFTKKLVIAQSAGDLNLIHQKLINNQESDSVKRFSLLRKKNPFVLPFTTTLYFYQNIISPQLATECPHIPSCSSFSKQSIAKYGFVKGVALSADRLTRCSPISIMDLPSYSFDYFTNKINDLPIYYYFKHIKR